jgi:hypothetical protein
MILACLLLCLNSPIATSSSPRSSDSIRDILTCWTHPNGTWVPDHHPFSINYSDPTGQWSQYKAIQCPIFHDPTPYTWKPISGCPIKFSPSFTVKKICAAINGRPLVFIGDSLMFYSYLTFIILMADRQPFVLSSDGTTRFFHYDLPTEFTKYPARTYFSNFSEACEAVKEKPFVLFMNPNQYLDINPIFHTWLEKHPNALLFINRGYHYKESSPTFRVQLESILSDYLSRINTNTPTMTGSDRVVDREKGGDGGAVIWRSIHMSHPECQKYQNSYPFTSQNYSLYEGNQKIISALMRTHSWFEIIRQDQQFIRPLLSEMIQKNTHGAREKLFYLDIFSSSRLQIRRHSSDCLHYCLEGPMDSWLILLLNTIRLIDTKRRHPPHPKRVEREPESDGGEMTVERM